MSLKTKYSFTYWKVEPILLPFSGTPGSGQTSPARPLWPTERKERKMDAVSSFRILFYILSRKFSSFRGMHASFYANRKLIKFAFIPPFAVRWKWILSIFQYVIIVQPRCTNKITPTVRTNTKRLLRILKKEACAHLFKLEFKVHPYLKTFSFCVFMFCVKINNAVKPMKCKSQLFLVLRKEWGRQLQTTVFFLSDF